MAQLQLEKNESRRGWKDFGLRACASHSRHQFNQPTIHHLWLSWRPPSHIHSPAGQILRATTSDKHTCTGRCNMHAPLLQPIQIGPGYCEGVSSSPRCQGQSPSLFVSRLPTRQSFSASILGMHSYTLYYYTCFFPFVAQLSCFHQALSVGSQGGRLDTCETARLASYCVHEIHLRLRWVPSHKVSSSSLVI